MGRDNGLNVHSTRKQIICRCMGEQIGHTLHFLYDCRVVFSFMKKERSQRRRSFLTGSLPLPYGVNYCNVFIFFHCITPPTSNLWIALTLLPVLSFSSSFFRCKEDAGKKTLFEETEIRSGKSQIFSTKYVRLTRVRLSGHLLWTLSIWEDPKQNRYPSAEDGIGERKFHTPHSRFPDTLPVIQSPLLSPHKARYFQIP